MLWPIIFYAHYIFSQRIFCMHAVGVLGEWRMACLDSIAAIWAPVSVVRSLFRSWLAMAGRITKPKKTMDMKSEKAVGVAKGATQYPTFAAGPRVAVPGV